MGMHCHIYAHFPVTEFSAEEQTFLAELRRRLPDDEVWLQLPWEERVAFHKAVHEQLGIPGEADRWQFVKQWQHDGNWYVTSIDCGSPSPPFPRPLADYPCPFSRGLPAVWLVAFTAPGRWQPEFSSIYQSLGETRRHVRQLFDKVWHVFNIGEYHHDFTDQYDLRQIRSKAPPDSIAHQRLRGVFSLFKLHDFTDLHRLVLSQDLPSGTILELDIGGLLYNFSEGEAKALFQSDKHLAVLDAVERMDLDALVGNKLLESLGEYNEDVIPWLDAADAWCEIAMYLR
jgi:hypothetical protein